VKNVESERDRIISYFNPATLQKWAQEIEQCDGNHADLHLLENVRAITTHKEFEKLYGRSTDYLIPDGTFTGTQHMLEYIPRDFVMDVILYAGIMVHSKIIQHGITANDMESIYKHHCVEPTLIMGKAYGMTTGDSLTVLNYYIQRVVYKLK
jgi:hypothetical protein